LHFDGASLAANRAAKLRLSVPIRQVRLNTTSVCARRYVGRSDRSRNDPRSRAKVRRSSVPVSRLKPTTGSAARIAASFLRFFSRHFVPLRPSRRPSKHEDPALSAPLGRAKLAVQGNPLAILRGRPRTILPFFPPGTHRHFTQTGHGGWSVESECGRGDLGLSMSVSAPFRSVWRCFSGSAVFPFPPPLIEPDVRISRIRSRTRSHAVFRVDA